MGTLTKKIEVKIDGLSNKDYKDYNFLNIKLVQELLKPNELTFTMEKISLVDCAEDGVFPVPKKLMGAQVNLTIETIRFDEKDYETSEKLEFRGYIINVEVYRKKDMFSQQLIDVQAFSFDYQLMDHPHCRSFEDMTLDAIVKEVFKDMAQSCSYSLATHIGVVIPYTVQYNETNYQFLKRLAIRFGEWMYYDGNQFFFGGNLYKRDKVLLDPRNDIIEYRFKSGLIHHKIKHIAYDYVNNYTEVKTTDKDCSTVTKPGYSELADEAWKKSEKFFPQETILDVNCNKVDYRNRPADLSSMTVLCYDKTKQSICTGTTVRADLKLGSVITIRDEFFYGDDTTHIMEQHDDQLIVKIVHFCDVKGNYRNEFTSVSNKVENYPPYDYNQNIYPVAPPQRAKVKDNLDPEQLGRVRVQFLWQEEQDPDMMTPWIRIAQPHGGQDKGFFFIPEIDEEVMVDYENGNAECPYVVGTFYRGEQKPNPRWYNGDINAFKVIRTRNNHTIEFVDGKDGGGMIVIHDGDNVVSEESWTYAVQLSTDEKLVRLMSKGNIELIADYDIIMKAKNDISMEAKHNLVQRAGNTRDSFITKVDTVVGENVLIQATGGNVKMIASADIKAHADGNCDISASSDLYMQGATVNAYSGGWMALKASGENNLIGGGTVTIKGSTVNIN